MSKKEKKEKKKKRKREERARDGETPLQFKKMEAHSQIQELQHAEMSYKMSGKIDEAIICADQIIRIAIQFGLDSYIKEQEDFINSIAKKINTDHLIEQINEYTFWIDKQYDKLIESGAITQAHDLVESLKERYKDFPEFDTIEKVQSLISKDTREWIKYYSHY